MKKLIRFLLILTIVALPVISYSEQVNIFILNTGDIHESSNNLDKIKTFVSNERNKHKYLILVDAGDMLSHWTPKSRAPFTEPNRDWALARKENKDTKSINQMFNWASGMKYDAMIIGNHDFDGGIDLLKRFPKLPFICANLEYPSKNPFYLGKNGQIPLYKIVTLKNGIKVGIIGISEQADSDYPNDPNKDYHFPDSKDKKDLTAHPVYNDTMQKLVDKVAEQSDFIIILSHNKDSVDTDSVAALKVTDVEGSKRGKICAIIGGHSHEIRTEQNVKGKTLIKSGVEGSNVGSTMVTWDTEKQEVVKVTVKNFSM